MRRISFTSIPPWAFHTKLGDQKIRLDFLSDMGVSENRGTPKSSILIGFAIINHPFWGIPIFGNTHMGCKVAFQIEWNRLNAVFWTKDFFNKTSL